MNPPAGADPAAYRGVREQKRRKPFRARIEGSPQRAAGNFRTGGIPIAMRRPKAALFTLILLLPLLLAWADSWEGLRDASRAITSVEARFTQKKTLPIRHEL